MIGDEANVEGEEDEKFLVLKISVNCLGNKQRVHEENLILTATVHSTCSPTQLFTQGQWWSIFLIHLNRSPCSKTFEKVSTNYVRWSPLAHRAVMCPFWLDATALGAFEDHLRIENP